MMIQRLSVSAFQRLSVSVFSASTLLLAFQLFSLSTFSAPTTNDAALWRPRLATPAIVALDAATNRQFIAEVKAPASAKKWSASIANDLKTWRCKILSANYSTINRNTEPGWQIKVSVPTDASPELFTLTVANSETVSVQRQAISIVSAFATNFYVLHITDEQIVNKIHTDPSGQYYKMVGTWEEMNWMQEPVNLINPRFVIITGDQIDFNGALDGWNNWSNWGYQPTGKKIFTEQETTDIGIGSATCTWIATGAITCLTSKRPAITTSRRPENFSPAQKLTGTRFPPASTRVGSANAHGPFAWAISMSSCTTGAIPPSRTGRPTTMKRHRLIRRSPFD